MPLLVVFSQSQSEKRMTARDQTRRGSLPGSATALKSKWLVFRSDTNGGFVLQMPLFLVYECSLCRLRSSAATLSIPAMEYQQRNQDWKRISGAGTAQFLECLAQALPALLALHSLLRMPRRSEFDTNNNGPSSLRVSFQPTLVVWEALNPGIWFVFCRAPRPPAVSVSCGHGSAE